MIAVQHGRANVVSLCWERPSWTLRRRFGSCAAGRVRWPFRLTKPKRCGFNGFFLFKIFLLRLFHLLSCCQHRRACSGAFQRSSPQPSDLTGERNPPESWPERRPAAPSRRLWMCFARRDGGERVRGSHLLYQGPGERCQAAVPFLQGAASRWSPQWQPGGRAPEASLSILRAAWVPG